MNTDEARTILDTEMRRYQAAGRDALVVKIGNGPDVIERPVTAGNPYQIEIQVMWDGDEGGDVRVIGAIDDGSLRWACMPLTLSFLVTVDGEIV